MLLRDMFSMSHNLLNLIENIYLGYCVYKLADGSRQVLLLPASLSGVDKRRSDSTLFVEVFIRWIIQSKIKKIVTGVRDLS